MHKQRSIYFVIVAIILALGVCATWGTTSAANSNAPRPKATATPTVTPTPSGPTPTPGPTSTPLPSAPNVSTTELTSGWSLISANNVTDAGTAISQTGYNAASWYPITVPSTVLAGLVANN